MFIHVYTQGFFKADCFYLCFRCVRKSSVFCGLIYFISSMSSKFSPLQGVLGSCLSIHRLMFVLLTYPDHVSPFFLCVLVSGNRFQWNFLLSGQYPIHDFVCHYATYCDTIESNFIVHLPQACVSPLIQILDCANPSL